MSRRFTYKKTSARPDAQDMLTLWDGDASIDTFSARSRATLALVAQDWMMGMSAQYIDRKWTNGGYHREAR